MSEIEETRKESMKSIVFISLFAGGIFSTLIYIIGYRNGVVTAGPYVAVLLFLTCCLISIGALIYGYIFPAINKLKNPMKNIFYGLMILVFCIVGFYGYSPLQNLVTSTYYLLSGEDPIDSYLAEYKFEEARKANFSGDKSDRIENLKKITIAEAKFWASQGEFDRALKVVDETWMLDDYEWNDSDWEEFRLSIIEDGIDKLCIEKRDFVQSKYLAMKANEYYRESLNDKIAEYEKIK